MKQLKKIEKGYELPAKPGSSTAGRGDELREEPGAMTDWIRRNFLEIYFKVWKI